MQTHRSQRTCSDVRAELPGWERPRQDLADHLHALRRGASPTPSDQLQWQHSGHDARLELPGQEQQRQDLTNHLHDLRRGASPTPSDQTQGNRAQQARCTRGALRVGAATARRRRHLHDLRGEVSPCRAIKHKEIAHSGHEAHAEQQQDVTGTCAIWAEKHRYVLNAHAFRRPLSQPLPPPRLSTLRPSLPPGALSTPPALLEPPPEPPPLLAMSALTQPPQPTPTSPPPPLPLREAQNKSNARESDLRLPPLYSTFPQSPRLRNQSNPEPHPDASESPSIRITKRMDTVSSANAVRAVPQPASQNLRVTTGTGSTQGP
ncbi:hypothetical protein BC826DRAFT_1109066 [Russula brevipes]|nr:hypothetical protein BC826DRAFT_1109066 [Russula brevipes]